MDISAVAAAYNGLKTAKDIFSDFADLKTEIKSQEKINAAVKSVSEAQDTLFQLREQLFRLQEENSNLKQELSEKEEWNKRLSNYELFETPGGAVVYKSKEGTNHYICPRCIEKKEIQILQDRKVMSGDFACPGCGKDFPVSNSDPIQTDTDWTV